MPPRAKMNETGAKLIPLSAGVNPAARVKFLNTVGINPNVNILYALG